MTCPNCNGTGEDWTNVSTESGALNGEDCNNCREPTPAEEAECRRALELFALGVPGVQIAESAGHDSGGTISDLASYVRELADEAARFAALATRPTAHPNYQHEKIARAWDKLTVALLALGVPIGDLHDAVDRAADTPVARFQR